MTHAGLGQKRNLSADVNVTQIVSGVCQECKCVLESEARPET